MALGISSDCSTGGAVLLLDNNGAATDTSAGTLVTDPTFQRRHVVANSSSPSNASLTMDECVFGRVVLLVDDILFVGAPDAYGGAGAVGVFDVGTPSSPIKLCEWRPRGDT